MHGGNVWQEAQGPEEWLDFSANLRPEGPPEWVKAALAQGLEAAGYYPDPSQRAARQGLAEYLSLDADFVLPAAGGIAAIDLVNSLEVPETLIPVPGFGEYAETAAQRGRNVQRLPFDAQGKASPARALLGSVPQGGLVWLCNPHNPTGRASAPEEIAALLREVEAVGGYLAVDEAFIDYCPERSVRTWIRAHERLIVVGSLTKILAVPGVRLGYVCAQPRTLTALRRRQLPWSLNCFAAAVAAALPAHRVEIAACAAKNRVRREALRAALEGLGLSVYPSEAPFLLADLHRSAAPVAAALTQQKILVRECLDFVGIDDGRHLRLAVKDEAANARLIEALREAMKCAENH